VAGAQVAQALQRRAVVVRAVATARVFTVLRLARSLTLRLAMAAWVLGRPGEIQASALLPRRQAGCLAGMAHRWAMVQAVLQAAKALALAIRSVVHLEDPLLELCRTG